MPNSRAGVSSLLTRDQRRRNVVATLNKTYLHLVQRANLECDEGQALVEYALILAMISVVTIAVLQALGVDVSKILDKVSTSLSSAAG
jgi:Flp pilus assembly pilin Flp